MWPKEPAMNTYEDEDKRKAVTKRRKAGVDRRQLNNFAWLGRMERRKSRDDRRSGSEDRRKDSGEEASD